MPTPRSRRRRSARSPLAQRIRRLPGGAALLSWYRRIGVPEPDAYLISFPKCGRTWLRLMMGHALDAFFGLERQDLLDLETLPKKRPGVPRVRVLHDDDPHRKRPGELSTDKSEYRGKKVIFLTRDPRDVLVSNFFQKTRRDFDFHGDLSSYLRSEIGSVSSLIRWHNIWAESHELPAALLVVFYEDLHQRPLPELGRVFRFLGLHQIDTSFLDRAVAYAEFDKMQQLEAQGAFESSRLRPADAGDPESFKVRRGKIGGYRDYLDESDLKYVEDRLTHELSDFYARYK